MADLRRVRKKAARGVLPMKKTTWQKALNAWARGSKVKCVLKEKGERPFELIYDKELTGGYLEDDSGVALSAEEIRDGQWFV
jgi:hypothetical protein